MEISEFLSKNKRERLLLISNRNDLENFGKKLVAQILIQEEDQDVLNKLSDTAIYSQDSLSLINLHSLIDEIRNTDIHQRKRYFFVHLINQILYQSDDPSPYLKTYNDVISQKNIPNFIKGRALLMDNRNRLLKNLKFQKELELHSFSVTSTKDLVLQTTLLFESIKGYSFTGDFDLNLREVFIDENYNDAEKFETVLKSIMKYFKFPINIPVNLKNLFKLYQEFKEVENLLFTADSNHRDHAFHSFNVFLLGLHILLTHKELKTPNSKIYGTDFLCWSFMTFFHDIGYGLQKIEKLTEKFSKYFKNFGRIDPPGFHFSDGLLIYGQQKIKEINEYLKKSEIESKESYSTILPFLDALDNKEHGLMSALILLKTIDEYKANYPILKLDISENMLIQAAFAMTAHTLSPHQYWGIDIDRNLGDFKPHFAFLLTLIDSIEYLNRPIMVQKKHGIGTKPKKDVNIELEMKIGITRKRVFNIEIQIVYENKTLQDLIKIGYNIRKRIIHFVSTNWGVKITLKTKKDWNGYDVSDLVTDGILPVNPECTFYFLQNETDLYFSEWRQIFRRGEETNITNNDFYSLLIQKFLFNINFDLRKMLFPDQETAKKDEQILLTLNAFLGQPKIKEVKEKMVPSFQILKTISGEWFD